ncbi:amino acid adenylation domain-containing protein [Corallococcus exiguus]|uniref:Amino acid adenylation domain-containing protein n=5 Tax=Corallococcus exiguus TaxID=83462 RepID=A0A7X4Y6U3_9BACT|nr:non-ribosomal peptide synthase/polyketide synthase [Corallococcus exiguus]NBC40008.1 amino acid adenylation domain-containing protein [Corallococcus exiguus]
MSDIRNRIAHLPPEKREQLLRKMAERQQASGAPALDLPPAPRPARAASEPSPLSFAQQRLWFLDRMEPGTTLFNLPAAFRLRGPLDETALGRAFNALVERHESLRTRFMEQDGQPVQVAEPSLTLALAPEDLTGLPLEQREEQTRKRMAEEARRPFDLTRGPLLRTRLLRLSSEEHVLLLTMHHIVSDGWSIEVLIREVGVFYEAFVAGTAPVLPALPLQYADFARQQQGREGETLRRQLDYWKARLSGAPQVLELPTDLPRPAVQTFQGAELRVELPAALVEQLKALGRRSGATLYMVLLAAFQTVLHRYSGQDEVCVGTPSAGRSQAELEGLIGFFLNTLVLRTDLSGDPTFLGLLGRVREAATGAFDNQDVPFEKLVEELQPRRSLSYTPLFQVMLILQKPQGRPQLGGLALEAIKSTAGRSMFDLTLSLVEVERGGLVGHVEYSTDLFEEATIARLTQHLRTVLEAAVARPEAPLASLPLMPEAEQRQVLLDFNRTHADVPLDVCFHQLFEAQADRAPDAVAVRDASSSFSYRALDARSNRLAHLLVASGVQPDSLVALLAPRSCDFVASNLGVLKAAAAWLPLDPLHPPQRLAQILSLSRAPFVLVADVFAPLLASALALIPEGARPRVLSLEASLNADVPSSRLAPRASPSHLAYVIFTSGSTGTPKGAMVEQRGMLNHLHAKVLALGLGPKDVVAQTASQCFDISVWQSFVALLVGGQTLVLGDDVAHSPASLLDALEAHAVSIVESVPSLLNALLEEADSRGSARPALSHLRFMLPTGEALPAETARRWLLAWPSIPLVNAYGPTECSDDVTHAFLSTPPASSVVPIGRPVCNTRLYVLDSLLRPCPLGIPGELFVAGIGVGRGYLFDSSRTAVSFIPDPFSSSPGARLYRTGDRVRWLPDGSLDFLGRIDFQVKLRGFRIELGEIEASLRQLPAVRDVVVLVRQDSPGDARLVAYLCPRPGLPLDVSEVRASLASHLPEYMVPSAFVLLDALPLSSNGKVNRKALPLPDADASRAASFVPPRSRTEALLCGLFARLLRLERVGIDDDFFALGGHSLLATRLVAHVREALGLELPLRALFEASSPALLAQRLDALRDSSFSSSAPPLRPTPRDGAPPPLSFAQQRLWFLDRWQPQSAFYNVPSALRLLGALHLPALQSAFDELIRRHESLRTTFDSTEEEPHQLIHPARSIPLQVIDLSSLPTAERMPEARRLADAEAQRPFDLSEGPVLRLTLLRLEEQEHVLLGVMHHIVSDDRSIQVLLREVAALYDAFQRGQPSPLPPLPVQYADYAVWQRSWLQGDVLDARLGWWRQQLDGMPHALELPTDRPRPATQGHRGAVSETRLSRALSDSLRAFHRREGVTPFVTLLAATLVLLHRYSGQEDFALGTPVEGREQQGLEGLIGFFINTVVLRARPRPGLSFRELLAQARESTLGALAHQDVPFEKLVEALQPKRDPSRSPLFQVMIIYQQGLELTGAMPGLTLLPLEVEGHTARFDLSLAFTDHPEGLGLSFEYNTDLYDTATVARMAGHLQELLTGIVARPEAPLSELPLLTPAERQTLLVAWNDTGTQAPAGARLHELVEAQVDRTPDAPAVMFEGQRLTYRELDTRANQLAHHLRSLGVGPEVPVAVCLERSLEMVVGLLAILKAGGAWVPMDPSYPAERLTFMLEDAKAPVLLTQKTLKPALPATSGRVVCLDSDWDTVARAPDHRHHVTIAPEGAAYIIYTSGSTGRPKGALNTHAAIHNRLAWMQSAYSLTPGDAVLQKTPFGFDVSVWEFFWPLMTGARLVMARPGGHQDAAYLARTIAEERITTLHFVPSMLQVFMEQPGLESCASLQRIFSSGEALPADLARRCLERLPARLFNLYGPTEAAVDVTHWTCEHGDPSRTVPIGRPITNLRLHVLDARLRPVPVGIPGELYIGGLGLARGYHHRPDLTAERFVPDPVGTQPGARLYRTGDLARYRPDGAIEYLGRTDFQVKLRGFRIELGEIEACLGLHPAVREAVVVAREDVPGDPRLVAYVVPGPGQEADTATLRQHLQQRLPEYMVPAAFVVMTALPLSANGKLERRALPAPTTALEATRTSAPPRTRTEQLLCGLFARVLRLERVGPHDDFFALGGHSLLATRLVARVQETFGVELPLRAFFDAPTVAKLAVLVDARTPEEGSAPAPRPVPRDGALPLSFSQQRLWFLDQWQPGSPLYNIPAALELEGELDVGLLERCFQELIRRHEPLRTTFLQGEHGGEQRVHAEATAPLTVVDLEALPATEREQEARRLAVEEAHRPFDLARGPLMRVTLLRLESLRHVLLLTLHHIVSDGWSLEVLLRELAVLHDAFLRDEPSPLPPLPVQYADYAVWQRSWLQGDVLDAQLGWWRQQLDGMPRALELPTDRPRPALVTSRGAVATRRLPRDLSDALRAFHRREGVTPFTTYLAALQALLFRYSGQDDLGVGTPVSGRGRPELEGLIGLFINTLVLRARIDGERSFRELLAQAREAVLGAFSHQDVPFERLVEVLQPERDLSRTPLFQVMLVHQHGLELERALPGLTMRPLPVEGRTAKFDLTLYVTDSEQGQQLGLEYNADLFEPATAERMLGHLEVLLRDVTAHPERRVAELPLLTEAERHQHLVEWNTPREGFARGPTLHQRFEAQVALTPDALAATCGEQHLTYRQLDARANQVAWRLRSFGVGPETLVGLCVERSLDMVVGLLAILKAGGAYVPMDPSYPVERLAFMLEDTRVPVLVTQTSLQGALPAHGAHVVLLDDRGLEAEPVHAPDAGVAPENLAYVIYTSGSTGRPKGVQLAHEQVVRLMTATEPWYGFGAQDVWTFFHSYAFDFSVWELWGALLYGGRVVVVPYWVSRSPESFLSLLRRERVTVLNQTPSAFRQLLHADATSDEPGALSLRYVIFGGEALEFASLRPWFARHGDARPQLINMYGITETTVHVTYRVVHTADAEGGSGSIVGVPIPDLQTFVLDSRLQPQPVGIPGELYVGGPGLARGYLHRPELTAERFVPHPFATRPGERLYKTGDLARVRADGQLEYLGRLDLQVKIRGFRIELGEIETALALHPSVREAVVVAREDAPGGKRLVGYVTPAVGQTPDIETLRQHLQQRLPDYMVPAALVALESLPLTSNGKVDRRALPAPELERSVGTPFVAPRTEVEQRLADIWAKVLRREKVGLHDNFFALGGDSIVSLQIIARAHRVGLRLTPRQLFQHPTIAELAPLVVPADVPTGEQGPVVGPVPLTPIQRWLVERELKAPHHNNQAMVLELRQPMEVPLLEAALGHLLAHHDALRLRLTRTAEGWRQTCAEPGPGGVVVRRVDATRLEQVAGELQRGLSLEAGPLVAAALVDPSEEKSGRLLLVIHHLAVDGVSWRTLLEDLATVYRQLQEARAVSLPPKSTSFKAWAERLVAHAHSPAVTAELPFWLDASRSRVRPLPRDGAGGDATFASARGVTVSLSAEETRLLLQDVPAAYRARIDDVLLAALMQALAAWTGQPRQLVDLEGHGREDLFDDVDLSRTVGWFTALYPALLEVPSEASPGDAVRAVREALAKVPSRGLGHGLLRYLREDEAARRLRALPAAELSFNYLGQFDTDSRAEGPFTLVRESAGPTIGDSERRPHVLEAGGYVLSGRMDLFVSYSEALHSHATIQALATAWGDALRRIIAGRLGTDAERRTPADFPLARLAPSALERILQTAPLARDIYPLSPMQQGMLFHALFEPQVGMYLEQLTWTFHAPLDRDAFHRAMDRLVERQPLLRTALFWEGLAEPLQVVSARAPLPWLELDWRDASPADQQLRLEDFLARDRAQGFDLSRPPLMRLALIRLEENVTRMVWTYHHVLLDGWSLGLLFQELFTTYQALLRDEPLPDRSSPPFRDYVAWLQRRDDAGSEAFWRKSLRGFTEPTPLPLARPVSADAAPLAPGEREIHLSAERTLALQAFARDHQLTLNTLVQATWGLVLGRCAGTTDAVFGTTVSGRPPELTDVESMVGLFINALPVRVRMDPDVPVLRWLKELQAWQAEMRQHEHSPLVKVQGWSELPRGSSLFDSFLVFENYPVDTSVIERGSALAIRDISFLERINYPLAAMVIPDRQLLLRLGYDPARFSAEAIDQLLSHWSTALEAVLASPDQPLGALSLFTEEARRQVLVEWNASDVAFPQERLVHQLFEAQVARTPDAAALAAGDDTLSFQQLDARANQLAWHLRAYGVGPETRVALCLERSFDLVVSMLAVLKAGGAWVPLDPTLPSDRLAFMLADSGAPVVVTQDHLADELPAHGGVLVCVDADWSQVASRSTQPPPPRSLPDSLAYVIYTSGSTGKPKGTLLTHRGLANTALAAVREHRFDASSRVLQFASIGFDACVCEVFSSLLAGACLHLAPREQLLPGPPLHSLLRDRSISAVTLTPSVLAQLDPTGLDSLRTVISAGEALPAAVASRWAHPQRLLLNAYGPTEVTVCASIESQLIPSQPTIGAPFPNVRLFVLDSLLRPVPVGLPGELFVSGPGVARGYLGQPSLTAEKFIPHPFSREPGERLYRTGDRVRWLPSGRLEFLGRLDSQVKLRGFRIEPSEVSALLRDHSSVLDAFTLLREDSPSLLRLVSYVVSRDESPDEAPLRAMLKARVPEYMVPAAFVFLDALPLTASGKVDTRALPVPGTPPARAALQVAPRDTVEELLATLWAELLGVERVGIHDDFFDLGGHSLLATQLVARLRAVFDVDVSLQELFDRTTVARLADRLRAPRSGSLARPPPITPSTEDGEVPLSHAQAAYWSPERMGAASVYNQVLTPLRLDGPLDVEALRRTIEELVRRHEPLRTTFPSVDGQPVQRVAPPTEWELPVEDLRPLPEDTREQALMSRLEEEGWRPFDMEHGPLMRTRLFRVTDSRHVLMLAVHHALTDQVSGGVMLRELTALYPAFRDEQPSPLPELTVSYRDYTRWQREWMRGEVLEHHRNWWIRRLEKPLPASLPLDRPRPEDGTFHKGRHGFTLPPALSARFHSLARRESVTPFLLGLAAFKTFLARTLQCGDTVVGIVHANRPRPELEPLVGMFASYLLLRTDLSGNPSFREVLRRVRASYLESSEHQDLPHAELVSLLRPGVVDRRPLSPLGYVFHASAAPTVTLAGLEIQPLDADLGLLLNDLQLLLTDGPDGLTGHLEYRTELFDAATIARMADALQALLMEVVEEPDRPLTSLSPPPSDSKPREVA